MSTERTGKQRGRGLVVAVLLLGLAGIALSIELLRVHIVAQRNFAGGQSSGPAENANESSGGGQQPTELACDLSEQVSCSDVALSEQSEVLGVPVPVWGLMSYLFLIGVGLIALQRRTGDEPLRGTGVILLFGSGATGYSIYLGLICVFVIRKLCIWCTALYGVNLLLLVLAVLLIHRVGGLRAALRLDIEWIARFPARTAAYLLVFAVAGIVLLVTRDLWRMPLPPLPPSDVCGEEHHTAEGFPLLGRPEALVTIEEFSDYECGFCRRAHDTLRRVLDQYKDQVRMIHRHFPLDQECNPLVQRPFHHRACAAARAAICAAKQGKFWPFHDILFQRQQQLADNHLHRYAEQVGLDMAAFDACRDARETHAELERDIRAGMGWQIQGTPTFIINGQLFKGAMNEQKLKEVIAEVLKRCESSPAAAKPSVPPQVPASPSVVVPAPAAPPANPAAPAVPAAAVKPTP